jgi:hypothetical protein
MLDNMSLVNYFSLKYYLSTNTFLFRPSPSLLLSKPESFAMSPI